MLVIALVFVMAAPSFAYTATWQCQRCGKVLHVGGNRPPAAGACEENNWNPHIWARIG